MENTRKVLFEDNTPQWFVAVDDSWLGPLSASDVYEKINNQELTWAHYIWKEGQSEWKRICDVKTFHVAVPHQPPKSVQQKIKTAMKPVIKQGSRRVGAGAPQLSKAQTAKDKVWFLYYNDTQYGPFSQGEIGRFLNVGKIHGKVYVWRGGMDNWKRLSEVSPFSEMVGETRGTIGGAKSDQRTTPRRPLVAKILLANDDSVTLAVCRDISIGGMQVLTDKVPGKVGSKIKLNVSPAGGAGRMEPFVAEGLIVRILEDGRGFSFRFDRLTENARRSIQKYIESTQ